MQCKKELLGKKTDAVCIYKYLCDKTIILYKSLEDLAL